MNKVLFAIVAVLVVVSFAGFVFADETRSDNNIEPTVTSAGETKSEKKKLKKFVHAGGAKRVNVVASGVALMRSKIKEMTVEQWTGKTAVVSDSNMFFAARTFATFIKNPTDANDVTYSSVKNIIDNWLNFSVGGAESQEIIPIIEDYIEKWPNGKLVVSVGTNNIALGDSVRLMGDYKSIIAKCKAKGTNLTFIFVLPRRPDQTAANEKVDEINNRLANLCDQEGIGYCNASKPFKVSPDNPIKQVMKLFNLLNDKEGLHLSEVGHLRWGEGFSSAVHHLPYVAGQTSPEPGNDSLKLKKE